MGMGTLFIDLGSHKNKLYDWFSQVQGKGWSFLFKCLMIDAKNSNIPLWMCRKYTAKLSIIKTLTCPLETVPIF
jgi:hypothetical protein